MKKINYKKWFCATALVVIGIFSGQTAITLMGAQQIQSAIVDQDTGGTE